MNAWTGLRESFSVARWWSIVMKEFLQLRRDRVTFAMIVGVPLTPSLRPRSNWSLTGLAQLADLGSLPSFAAVNAALRSAAHHTETISL